MEKSQVSCSRTGSKAERERALQWVGWPASFIPKNKSSIKQGLHHQAHSWIPACESSSRPIYPSVITTHGRHFKWSGKTITPQVHSSPLQYRWELLRYDRKLFEHYHGIKMHIFFFSSFFFTAIPPICLEERLLDLALGGFLLVTFLDGKVVFTTENVNKYIGINQVNIWQPSLYRFLCVIVKVL